MGRACLWLSSDPQMRQEICLGSGGMFRQKALFITLAGLLLHSVKLTDSLVSAFSLHAHTPGLSSSWQPGIRPLPPLLAASISADSAGTSEEAGKYQQQDDETDVDTELEGGYPIHHSFPLDSTAIRSPMQHQPRGTRLIPGFPGPQFVSLRPSALYRRRLRRHRRDEGWQFSNLPVKRVFFAARRNHRDQLMHKWLYTRHVQCKRRAKEVRSVLQTQRREIFDDKIGEGHAPDSKEEALEPAPAQATANEAPVQALATVGSWSEAGNEPSKDCITAVRAALKSVPSAKVLSTMSAADLGRLHAQLRELLVDAVIAVAPPERVAAAASEGFSLPPPEAALAASPFPWWSSARGLQPWRGRKVSWAQQSRRVNWANPRRSVEPMVAGVLLPKEAAAVVAAERNARNRELLDSIRSFLFASSTDAEGQTEASSSEPAESCGAPAENLATPWFIRAEEDRLNRLLRWDGGRKKEQTDAPLGSSSSSSSSKSGSGSEPSSSADLPREEVQESESQNKGEERSFRCQQATCGEAGGVRRALGAAIDVALLLSEATITKKSGAAAPFSWESPFLRSASSSKRRRWRERGRPAPEQRLPSRQARRLANKEKRLARKRASDETGK